MKIFIGSDHAGFQLKETIKQAFPEIEFVDLGTNSTESVDYPDYAFAVAENVAKNPNTLGILACGSGIGVDICANKVKGIRSALVYNPTVAQLSREHDDANVLCLAARYFTEAENLQFVKIFLESCFTGGRHARRVDKIISYETNNKKTA